MVPYLAILAAPQTGNKMDRQSFHTLFDTPGPVVTPVIHVLDLAQARRNIAVAVAAGAHGVFLINHDFPKERLLPILRQVRAAWPELWLGVNFLAVTGRVAFPLLGGLEAEGYDFWNSGKKSSKG